MQTTRFFVANVPSSTTEKQLSQLFVDYGEVTRVELKKKESQVDAEDVKIIAFVTLKINEEDAQYCLNELNWQKINGAKIKVSIAKESFLERLKREREEAESAAAGVTNNENAHESVAQSSTLLSGAVENTRKTFAEDLEFADDDDELEPGLLITKKRAASSLHNGKIVIQNFDATPIHVIQTKKPAKQLDAKSATADQKRKKSLNKMKTQYQDQKNAIQNALAGLDGSTSKKIKFSDAEDDDDDAVDATKKSKTNIFGSDNEADDDNAADVVGLKLKPELFGKKGEKLVQMQANQSLDPRFKIDAKFVDEDDEHEVEDTTSNKHNVETNVDDERNWQMGLLEQVMGTKLNTDTAAQRAAKNKKMLRFDPSKDEHQKLLRTKVQDSVDEQKDKKKKKNAKTQQLQETDDASTTAPEVSKEVFYVVTDTLTQSLKTRGDGFSLLNMFGKTTELEEREEQLKKVSNEKILVNKSDKPTLNQAFDYDSATESENEMPMPDTSAVPLASKQKVKIAVESFFIPKNDARLKEGAKFFKFDKKTAVSQQDYEAVRDRLKLLIRTKITKTKKNLGTFNQKGRNKKVLK